VFVLDSLLLCCSAALLLCCSAALLVGCSAALLLGVLGCSAGWPFGWSSVCWSSGAFWLAF